MDSVGSEIARNLTQRHDFPKSYKFNPVVKRNGQENGLYVRIVIEIHDTGVYIVELYWSRLDIDA